MISLIQVVPLAGNMPRKDFDSRARLEQARKKLMADFDDFPSNSNSKPPTALIAAARPKPRKMGSLSLKSQPAKMISATSRQQRSNYLVPQHQEEPRQQEEPWITKCVCFGSACFGQLGASLKMCTHCTTLEPMVLPTHSGPAVPKRVRKTASREQCAAMDKRKRESSSADLSTAALTLVTKPRPTSTNPTHLACGGNMTLVVMESGEVYSMGTGAIGDGSSSHTTR